MGPRPLQILLRVDLSFLGAPFSVPLNLCSLLLSCFLCLGRLLDLLHLILLRHSVAVVWFGTLVGASRDSYGKDDEVLIAFSVYDWNSQLIRLNLKDFLTLPFEVCGEVCHINCLNFFSQCLSWLCHITLLFCGCSASKKIFFSYFLYILYHIFSQKSRRNISQIYQIFPALLLSRNKKIFCSSSDLEITGKMQLLNDAIGWEMQLFQLFPNMENSSRCSSSGNIWKFW